MELAGAELADGMPPRLARDGDQAHRRLVRRAIPLLDVAREARAHDVLPARAAAAGERNNVVERELRRGEPVPAVLAAVAVSRVDVVSRELHLLSRQAVEVLERDSARNADRHGRR